MAHPDGCYWPRAQGKQLAAAKKEDRPTSKATAALGVRTLFIYTANGGVTDTIQRHRVGLVQVAIHWYKPGFPEPLLGCLQYFVHFLIKEEAPPVCFVSTQAAAPVASY